MRKLIALCCVGLAVWFGFRRGMYLSATPVSEITSHPADFEGKKVKVHGVVEATTKLPMVAQRFYLLRDGDKRLPVMSYDELPKEGKEITLVGTVSSAAIVGGMNAGVHLRVGQATK